MPATSQLDWLSSTTAMIVLFWSRATRDLLKSFGWGIAALHRLHAATKLPFPRRPPHRISQSRLQWATVRARRLTGSEGVPLLRSRVSRPGPIVRIQLPPPASLQTVGRSREIRVTPEPNQDCDRKSQASVVPIR